MLSITLGTQPQLWRRMISLEDIKSDRQFLGQASPPLSGYHLSFTDDLRYRDSAKIRCGEAHFNALAVDENPARFGKASKLEDVISH